MVDLRVVLVEPIYCGNIGSISRVLKNFGFSDLVLVNPCDIDEEAHIMASHATDILEGAKTVESVQEAVYGSNLIIGTTSKPGSTTDEHIRMPFFSPKELKEKINDKLGTITILFGREDVGLSNNIIKICDMVVYIPTSPTYPVMNISHATSVILYELSDIKTGVIPMAKTENKERFFSHLNQFLGKINYPPHKREKTLLMVRRILGRAELTGREVQTLHGILSRAELTIDRNK